MRFVWIAFVALSQLPCNANPLPLDTGCDSDTVKLSLSGSARDTWGSYAGIYYRVGLHNDKPLWAGGALKRNGMGVIYLTKSNGWMVTWADSMEELWRAPDGTGGIHYHGNTGTWSYVESGKWVDVAGGLVTIECEKMTAEKLLNKKLYDAVAQGKCYKTQSDATNKTGAMTGIPTEAGCHANLLWPTDTGVYVSTGDLSTVEQLITEGAQPDGYRGGISHMTALEMASYRGLANIARALVAAGADVNASYLGSATRVCQSLDIKHNVNLFFFQCKGMTALMYASTYDHLDVVRVLVKEGKANVNAKSSGMTALMVASFSGYLDIVRFLVEDGNADVTLTDNDGLDALSLTRVQDHSDVVAYLKSVTPTNSPGSWGGLFNGRRSSSVSIQPSTLLALLVMLFAIF